MSIILSLKDNLGWAGTLVGFVLAVFWAWKWLQNPAEQGDSARRPSSHSQIDRSHQTGATTSTTSSERKKTVDSYLHRKLNGGRKMTVQVSSVLLEAYGSQKNLPAKSGSLSVVLELLPICDIYLLAKVANDEEEEAIRSSLASSGIIGQTGVHPNKLLFCETQVGLVSFVRQLEPDWHVDSSVSTVLDLQRFVRQLLLITDDSPAELASNIFSSPSLELYFSAPSQQAQA